MKAAIYKATGPAAEVLSITELKDPTPGKGQVRVQVRASGVNICDTQRRSGARAQPFTVQQVIPHSDGAGVIDRLGSGVDKTWLGSRVWFHNAQWHQPCGAAAEYVVLPISHIAPLPEAVSFEAGATLGLPLLTAWQALALGGDIAGKTVLVTGGAGAVGAYAVQLAKVKGARVIATVSSEEKACLARKYGADEIINYRRDNVAKCVQRLCDGHGVDHYIEVNLSANADTVASVLAAGGSMAVYGSDSADVTLPNIVELLHKRIRIEFFLVYDLPPAVIERAKQEIQVLLETGRLKFPIATVFPMKDIARAHEAVEAGVIGNVVLCQCPSKQ